MADKLILPEASEPIMRDGKMSSFWYKFFAEVERLGNAISVVATTAAGKTLSSLADVVSTTRGAILFRGVSEWQALAPGTSGGLLQTNGAGADPSWAPPAASPVTQLASGSIANGTTNVDLALPPTYDEIEISIISALPVTDNNAIYLRFSQDNGSTFLAGASDYGWAIQRAGAADTIDNADTGIFIAGLMGNAPGEGGTTTVRLFKPGVSGVIKRLWFAGASVEPSGDHETFQGGGQLKANTDAVSHARVSLFSGNFASGFYSVRGYKY
jgi:hypothetical protein